MEKPYISKMEIQAYVDNELDELSQKRLEKLIFKNAEAKKYLNELYHQKKLLLEWWKAKIKN